MKRILAAVALTVAACGSSSAPQHSELPPAAVTAAVAYLRTHWQVPDGGIVGIVVARTCYGHCGSWSATLVTQGSSTAQFTITCGSADASSCGDPAYTPELGDYVEVGASQVVTSEWPVQLFRRSAIGAKG